MESKPFLVWGFGYIPDSFFVKRGWKMYKVKEALRNVATIWKIIITARMLKVLLAGDHHMGMALAKAKKRDPVILQIAIRLALQSQKGLPAFESSYKFCNAILCGCELSSISWSDAQKL